MWLKKKKGKIIWLNELLQSNGDGKREVVSKFKEVLDKFSKEQRDIFVSFDMDSIASSDAPGVSAPAVVGLTAQDALDICKCAGENRNVRLMDVSEFNPVVENFRTGRLLASMFYNFVMGVAMRKNI